MLEGMFSNVASFIVLLSLYTDLKKSGTKCNAGSVSQSTMKPGYINPKTHHTNNHQMVIYTKHIQTNIHKPQTSVNEPSGMLRPIKFQIGLHICTV